MKKVDPSKIVAIPKAQIVYGETVYWITVVSTLIVIIGPALSLIFLDNNVMNPLGSFNAIFSGQSPAEIWTASRDGAFPGGHFYWNNMFTGDGFTHFGVVLGCGVALPALLAAAVAYIASKSYGFALVCLWVAFLVFFAAAGIVSLPA
jgi:hypothetical protein